MKSNKTTIKNFLFFAFCIFYILILVAMSILFQKLKTKEAVSESIEKVVIIDAGHGGSDGGAVGKGGIIEKDINLDISILIKTYLEKKGIKVIMTRESDELLDSETLTVKGTKKQNDLRSRLEIADNNQEAIFVSIHLNSFPQESCKGLQVYYSKNNQNSQKLAKFIQDNIKELQPTNNRKTKAAGSSIFLLYHAKNPSVLIECGFLSNTEESKLLTQDEYKQSLAKNIANSIEQYFLGT